MDFHVILRNAYCINLEAAWAKECSWLFSAARHPVVDHDKAFIHSHRLLLQYQQLCASRLSCRETVLAISPVLSMAGSAHLSAALALFALLFSRGELNACNVHCSYAFLVQL